MKKPTAGRVVAITGGAAGIGRAIAEHLARAGARVAIGDRDAAAAARTASELPGQVAAFPLDVTDTASFTTFLESVESELGPIDVLINNAGVMWVGSFDAEPEEAIHRQLAVNLHGVIRGTQLVTPAMRARGSGHIITIASAASKVSPPGEATYAATKHGVLGYLRAVRTELQGTGIEISVILPGVVDTELARGTSTGATGLLQPADVARAVLEVLQHPRFEVPIPRLVAIAPLVDLLPQSARDLLLARLVPNQITHSDKASRRTYEQDTFNP
ncbi:SDR family oxidoreductase [Nocardia sp. 2]|uniref:SDR family oxidoreductase n=1 Tax=Nocardia acididurans TaxID=2802282 RepID=A0ABS1LZ13_9NOCA|nr:SDR family oxidoreductase [Nocardia acididurans]MBL1073663.1 SDR family oxidoreductase [Nocardia acididurans]